MCGHKIAELLIAAASRGQSRNRRAKLRPKSARRSMTQCPPAKRARGGIKITIKVSAEVARTGGLAEQHSLQDASFGAQSFYRIDRRGAARGNEAGQKR